MDNATKEKILEIAGLCNGCLEGKSSHPSDGCYSCEDRGAYYGALKMAEWKQQQMTERAVKWLEEHITEYASFDDADISDSENKARFFDDFEMAMDEYEHPKVAPESIRDKAREIARDYAPTVENADVQTVILEAVMEMAKWMEVK